MAKNSKPKIYIHKSFYLTPSDKEMLEYLSRIFGLNESATIRRLLTESFSIIKYAEQKK